MNLKEYRFEDIVIGEEGLLRGPFGSDLKKSLYVPKGDDTYKVYLQENILYEDNSLGTHYISKEYYDSKMARYAVKEGDFIITCDGTLGEIFLLKDLVEKGIISSSLLRVTLNEEIVDKNYFYYLWKALLKKQLTRQSNNSVLKHLPGLGVLKKHIIKLPDLHTQKTIGIQLKRIDEKIKVNNCINDNLHEMLKMEYGYRFLQNLKKDLEQVSISNLADLYQPKTISGDELIKDGKYLVYGANGIIGRYNSFNHEEETIAIACRGASCGELQMTLPECWITGNAMVVKPKASFPYREFLYYTMLWNKPKRLVSGSAQPQITRDNLSLYEIKIPNEIDLKEFEEKAQIGRKIITTNLIENQKLADLRDWLLPMLMNGQAIIKE